DIDVSDRDQSGTQMDHHGYTTSPLGWQNGNGNFYDGLGLGLVRTYYDYKGGKPITFQLFTGECNFTNYHVSPPQTYSCPTDVTPAFAMTRADGYGMVGGLVQGARTYDPTSGEWLTPDAYAGNVHDPMSQKPFIWNGNNAAQFADPTGYLL